MTQILAYSMLYFKLSLTISTIIVIITWIAFLVLVANVIMIKNLLKKKKEPYQVQFLNSKLFEFSGQKEKAAEAYLAGIFIQINDIIEYEDYGAKKELIVKSILRHNRNLERLNASLPNIDKFLEDNYNIDSNNIVKA